MGDAGFYRGTDINQDGRYTDKEKKLLKQMKFEPSLDTKVDLKQVNLDVVKPWITAKLNTMLGLEDDIVAEFVFTQLEEKNLNPKIMQINLTGFLNARRAREFMGELWNLLIEAANSADGIPVSMINKKMEELKASASSSRRDVPMAKATENDWKNRYNSLVGGRYGKDAPNYESLPGAGDELNKEPESPSTNRRFRRERTPDFLPIPRRRRGDEDPERRIDRGNERDRGNDRDRDNGRYRDRENRRRSRSRSRERRRRSPSPRRPRRSRSSSPIKRPSKSPSPIRRRFEEKKSVRHSESSDRDNERKHPSPKSEVKKRRHNSGSDSAGSHEEKKPKKHKKSKKSKTHKKERD